MDEKLDSVLEYLGVLKEGLDRVEKSQTGMEEKQSHMEEELNYMAENQTSLEGSMELLARNQNRMEENQTSLEESMELLAQNQNRMEESQTSLEGSMELLARNQNCMEESQNRTEEKLDNFIVETRSGFKHVQTKLDGDRRMIKFSFSKQESTEDDVVYLIQKTEQHDTKINDLEKKMMEWRE